MRRALRVLIAGAVCVVSAGRPAAAQQSPTASPEPSTKSPRTAVLLSTAGVAIPALWSLASSNGAGIVGVLAGPAIGHVYAHNYGRAIGGTLGRTGIAALGLLTAALTCDFQTIFDDCNSPGAANAILLVAGGAIVTWMVFDVVHAGRSAERYNARHAVVAIEYPEAPRREEGRARGRGCVTIC